MSRAFDVNMLNEASKVACLSRCLRASVGAVIVMRYGGAHSFEKLRQTAHIMDSYGIGHIPYDKRVVAVGYNGEPTHGEPNCMEAGCDMHEGGCVRTLHAEISALLSSPVPVEGGTMYLTLSPCWACAKAIAGAGIKRVVFGRKYRLWDEHAERYARLVGVSFEHIEDWAKEVVNG